MKDHERNYFVANIIAGQSRCEVAGQHFVIKSPSLIQLAEAENIFRESYDQAALAGAYSEEALSVFLSESGIYTQKNEEEKNLLEKNIEDQKVGLFENSVRSEIRVIIRKALDQAKKEYNRLLVLKHSHDHLSSLGIAQIAKARYLLGCSVYYDNGSPYWTNSHDGWLSPDKFLDQIIIRMRNIQITDIQFRELARTEPWTSIWNSSKYCGNKIFDCPSSQLTNDQKILISWSSVYESVRESTNCPSDDIISDNDMLDGWMIVQRRERAKYIDKKMGEELISNEKIKNSSEIFIVTDKKDIGKVMNMNSEESKINLAARLNTIKKQGEVSEAQMPDTVLKNRQAVMDSFAARVRK